MVWCHSIGQHKNGNHKGSDLSYWNLYGGYNGLIKDSSLLSIEEDISNENTKRHQRPLEFVATMWLDWSLI